MTNAQKMAHHLAKAEGWQAVCEKYERAAAEQAPRQVHGRMGKQSALDLDYVADSLLDNFGYRKAVGARNFHQAQVAMYGIAALLDRMTP